MEKRIRTNSNTVRKEIEKHILDIYTIEDLQEEVKSMMSWNRETPTQYHAIKYMVQGGSFLCYHDQVKDFLNGLGINSQNKEYSDNKSWELYKHLIAINGEKLLRKGEKKMETKREWKFKSEVNGGIKYLYVDFEKKEYSTDFYKFNGGHRHCEMVQMREVKRLTEYYKNIMEYKEV